MNNNFRYIALLLFVLAIQIISAGSAQAIPAFSREHNTECATCHTIFPELNEYGDVFMKNGFVWNKAKKDDAAIKAAGESQDMQKQSAAAQSAGPLLGAPAKSEPLWLAGLPQTLPVSLAATLNASYNNDVDIHKVDLSTRAVSLLAGGVFREKIGFYLKYNLYAEGEFDPAVSNTPLNLSPPYANDLEEFYLIWRNTLGTPVNLKVGRFRPTLSLWKKSNKVGVSDYVTSSFRVGSSLFSADATEDAIEANAVLLKRLFIAAGVVDRNGQDTNEGYGHISLKIGGADFKGTEPEIDLDKESFLDYVYLIIGGYGYSGRNSGSITSSQRNNFYRAGADIDLVIKNARLKLAFARERDTNPDFASQVETTTNTWAGQVEYMFTPDFMAYFRYELLDLDGGSRINHYIPGISFAPIQNTKVTLEYQHVDAEKSSVFNDNDIVLLGVRVAL